MRNILYVYDAINVSMCSTYNIYHNCVCTVCICVCSCVLYACVKRICTYVCVHVLLRSLQHCGKPCMCACQRVCLHVRTFVCINYASAHVCVCTCVSQIPTPPPFYVTNPCLCSDKGYLVRVLLDHNHHVN